MSTGPPFERLYAVEPDGVEQMIPSHGCRPSSSPPTASSSSIMRPSDALPTTTSFTATVRPSGCSSSSVGSSTTSYSPAKTRPSPASRSRRPIELRNPTRPKLTPMTGTPVPRKRVSARRTVPSPPRTTARSADVASALGSTAVLRASSSREQELDAVLLRDRLQPREAGADLAGRAVRDDGGPGHALTRRRRRRSGRCHRDSARRVGARGGRRTPGSPSGRAALSLRLRP